MTESYCHSCYRSVRDGRDICPSCEDASSRKSSRVPLVIGSIGLPLLLVGIGTFNTRLCMAGGAIAAAAILTHLCLLLRR